MDDKLKLGSFKQHAPLNEDGFIVLIPGIGGSPIFHRDLVSSLKNYGKVILNNHGDFNQVPFCSLDEHTSFWRDIIDGLGPGPKLLVGISFGSFIALKIAEDNRSDITGVIMVSYWLIGHWEKILLSLLRRFPFGKLSQVFGWLLFKWSEIQSDDASQLKEIRLAIYKNISLTYRGLVGRLLCLEYGVIDLTGAANNINHCCLIYGEREWSFRIKRASLLRCILESKIALILVPGNHSISVRKNPGLIRAIEFILPTFGFRANSEATDE